MKLKRQITNEDLKDKGFPFECENCGNKPTPADVVRLSAVCDICGDSIIAYTLDTAELLVKLSA